MSLSIDSSFLESLAMARRDEDWDSAREIRVDYIVNAPISEQMWIEWLLDEEKIEDNAEMIAYIMDLAFKDYPYSPLLWHYFIFSSSDKKEAYRRALKEMGFMDNSIWDDYREFLPDEAERSFERQLSLPIPDYNRVLDSYKIHCINKKRQFHFEIPKQIQDVLLIRELFGKDMRKLEVCINLTQQLPSMETFEQSLRYHPSSEELWYHYATNFNQDAILARAVRFCPHSAALWSLRVKLMKEPDFTGFSFIKDGGKANILLGQLVACFPSQRRQILDFAQKHALFNDKDNWVFVVFLYDDFLRSQSLHEERLARIKEAISKNNQRIDLWILFCEINEAIGGAASKRHAFEEASSVLQTHKDELYQEWMRFEALAPDGRYDEVVKRRLSELSTSVARRSSETSELYESRTVFVAGFPQETTVSDLTALFSQISTPESVRLKKGFAFIQMNSEESATKAIKVLNGASFKGAKLDVKPHRNEQKFTFYIRFNQTANPSEIIHFLKRREGISSARIRLANTSSREEGRGPTKGYGFVDVSNQEDADKLLNLNGSSFLGKPFRVQVAQENRKQSKTQKPSKDDELKKLFGIK